MQRSIDRLLKASDKKDKNQKIIDVDGKIRFNRLQYDLDIYQTILSRISGFDFKKLKASTQSKKDESNKSPLESISKGKDAKASTQVISYEDELGVKQIAHLESVFQKTCKKCDTIKAPQSHHCSTCKACIARMDHHCPWVNNCVGYYNQKHFLLFLIYVFVGSSYAIVLISMKCYGCWSKNCWMFNQSGSLIIACMSIFLGVLFAIFTAVMLWDQISCIIENQSTIDKLQRKKALSEGKKFHAGHKPSHTSWELIC